MPIFHCQAKAISRAAGRSATAAAAYHAGERITDQRTGEIHDYRRKKGIIHAQIFVPQGVRIPARSALWNMAEAAENRKDAKVAREWEVALPAELDSLRRWHLAQHFARAIVERYGVAVDMCIHAPGKKGDDRNHHVHFLTSTRVLTPTGFTEKTRVLDSPRTRGQEVTAVRELWERLCNRFFELEVRTERIDHRSLKAQGIDREPTQHLGVAASSMERRGVQSLRGDENRRRRDPLLERERRELAVLQKIEQGIEKAELRHDIRKDRAEWKAELLQQAKKERRLAEERERAANRRGIQR